MNDQDRKDLAKYRIAKARETLNEVQIHIKNQLWNTAINRLYYASYYAVTALLINRRVKATTHTGVRQMFGLHFIKTGVIEKDLGKYYSEVFDMRQSGDYEDYIDFAEEDVMDLVDPAERLIERIEEILERDI